jgi:hypothetical protein
MQHTSAAVSADFMTELLLKHFKPDVFFHVIIIIIFKGAGIAQYSV